MENLVLALRDWQLILLGIDVVLSLGLVWYLLGLIPKGATDPELEQMWQERLERISSRYS